MEIFSLLVNDCFASVRVCSDVMCGQMVSWSPDGGSPEVPVPLYPLLSLYTHTHTQDNGCVCVCV